jgi:hypothetical protein
MPPPERKVRVEFLPGQMADGYEVSVDESTEKWSEYTLSDGTVIRGKMTLIGATRIEGQFDPQGNPMYQMNMAPTVIIISSRDDLKRRTDT